MLIRYKRSARCFIALEGELGVFLPILLPRFFGLDGVLYSSPTADVLTFILTVIAITRVYRELSQGSGLESIVTEAKATE